MQSVSFFEDDIMNSARRARAAPAHLIPARAGSSAAPRRSFIMRRCRTARNLELGGAPTSIVWLDGAVI